MRENVQEYLAFKEGKTKMPAHLKPRVTTESKLFKNKFLETITRTHVSVPIIMFLSVITTFLWVAVNKVGLSIETTVIVYFSAIFSWSFVEYTMHRFFYHTETNNGGFYKVQHSLHGIHHHHPVDKERLALPPIPAVVLASVFFGMFYGIFWVFGSAAFAFAFFPGFLTGYLMYISMHYAQHAIGNPKFKPFQVLWDHHKIHHYLNPYKSFGVSTRFWDFIFGTMPTKQEYEQYARIREGKGRAAA